MESLNPLLSSPSQFLACLKQQNDEILSGIVRANYNTQFAQAASELTEFRRATANSGTIIGMDNDSLSDIFRKTVHFTTYDTYEPFIAKFFEKPCRADSIADLLAPGLPDYLAGSGSTTGSLPKIFPKYDCSPPALSSGAGSWIDSNRRRTTLRINSLACIAQIDIEDGENSHVKKIYVCTVSAIRTRNILTMSPKYDEERMGTFVLDQAVPHAAAFIAKWRSFLVIHGLFALANRSLETMTMPFVSAFLDMVRYLDMEFDMVMDCIENGTIPSLEGVDKFYHYLEPNLLPDPERAAELRSFGRPSTFPGWCGRVWPKLHSVTCITSGSFASHVPLTRWYLGPNVNICANIYGSTETGTIGSAYNPGESNLWKLTKANIIEFLDIESSSDSVSSLSQFWEVEVGKRYEIVATNSNGLWRYRMGDIMEIAGFDPTDGIPIMKFIERRNAIMIIEQMLFTEEELRAAISSAPLENVVDWTSTIDDRWLPRTIGFFVELAGDEIPDLALTSRDQVWDTVMQLKPRFISYLFEQGRFRAPSIRLLRPGTFSDFRQLKLDEGGTIGQIKVPVVLPKPEYVKWFENQVVHEL